ncbi:hypothetical protein BCR39DRAFT_513805 [Naematelia encephala]|uniref:C2H2-type domain-containing protein n=1 Tax=Naematelia encephala TaxID=71784 RepID=A0A1Y2BIL5_9TREE|nr:hypothetical protein BCR39DRAFT_513805 [Naematelia encephala]
MEFTTMLTLDPFLTHSQYPDLNTDQSPLYPSPPYRSYFSPENTPPLRSPEKHSTLYFPATNSYLHIPIVPLSSCPTCAMTTVASLPLQPTHLLPPSFAGYSSMSPGEMLKRVLSQGSHSNGSTNLATPTSSGAPLSPMSGGVTTPRADLAVLNSEDVPVSQMDGLAVKSPVQEHEGLPGYAMNSTHLNFNHERSTSSSTDSSMSTYSHPVPPPLLGASYGPEGFPILNDTDHTTQPSAVELQMSAQAAAAVAAADEAIKMLNGTSTVIQGPPTPGLPPNPYELPRGYANFVNIQPSAIEPKPEPAVSRQSSTSSEATEASTSSEEEDLCIPSIEWVNIASPSTTPYSLQFPGSPGQRNLVRSPGRMPPPALKGLASPRRTSHTVSSLPHVPAGANTQLPSALRSAFPAGISSDAVAEDDDDDQTVGQRRERSPSTSSQSAQSGLDLLWQASQHPPAVYEGKGKRKAGAEAVAQWRASGIPVGTDSTRPTPSQAADLHPTIANPPLKRRRRSDLQEEIDPALRDPEIEDEVMESVDEMHSSEQSDADDGAEYGDDSDYGAKGRNKTAGTRRTGTIKKPAGGRGRTSTGTTTIKVNGQASGSGSGGKKARKSEGSPNGAGRGGGGGGGSGGSGGGRRGSNGGPPPGGVQCEYVNPLPPYNRCQDIFTRKYDLPRHMARHARREGELVYEGKLTEDKALLWRTIKDKPKVTCATCGESFTRMDALKRHQTKQNH